MPPTLSLSRRRFMQSTAVGIVLATHPIQSHAREALQLDQFMALSRFATGHEALDGVVGQGLMAGLRAKDDTFDAKADALAQRIAQDTPADVEALSDALQGDDLHDTLLAIIHAWYSGVVAQGTQATVYTFNAALMYQPALDAVPLPTYALNGPDWWTATPPALSDMPDF